MNNIIKQICSLNNIVCDSSMAATGGDINKSFVLKAGDIRYFLKMNSASDFPLMFVKEAEGLDALRQQALLKVPEVVASGELEGKQYLLLEYIEQATPDDNFWEAFAQGLAALHQTSHSFFGWHSTNYIGSLVQQNEWAETWPSFYTIQRIIPLTKNLFDKSFFEKNDLKAAERISARLNEIFPVEPPSLVHGDLWSGNFMGAYNGHKPVVPAIYDPAVYFGHREMDLGMSLLFGGFNNRFYDAYHSAFPLESGWRKRVPLTQLYPMLVHAILFGGGYISQCKTILKNWGG